MVTALALVSATSLLGMSTAAAAEASDGSDTDDTSAQEWADVADAAAQEAASTDWAAMSAAVGCVLVDVEVTEAVSEEINAALGAPEDLALPVVEREERCSGDARPTQAPTTQSGVEARLAMAGSDCAATDGPGQVCISRSGSYVTTSFQYAGSGTIRAFLKIYDTPDGASSCPTGTTLATGATSTYSDGTRRSLSVYAPQSGGYSAHVWKYLGVGINTNWGAACGDL